MNDLVSRFQQMDVSPYPDVHLLDEELDVVLWVLLVGSEKLGIASMSAAEIADVSTLGLKRALSRQRASALLTSVPGIVAREGRANPARFVLMRPGAERIRVRQQDVVIVDPESAFSALRHLDDIMKASQVELLICDPYVDDKTLIALTAVPTTVPIKLLTLNISDPAQFRRKRQAYDKEYGNLEVRISSKPDLHDRYLIDANRMLLLGQSLNGIGKKQTFIVTVGDDVRLEMERSFRQRWHGSSKWQ